MQSNVDEQALMSAVRALRDVVRNPSQDKMQQTVEIGEYTGTWRVSGALGEARLDAYVGSDGRVGARIVSTTPWPMGAIDIPPTTVDDGGTPLWSRQKPATMLEHTLESYGDDWRKASGSVFQVLRYVYLSMGDA